MAGFKFFKGKESTKVKKIGASRAIVGGVTSDTDEVHITFISEDNEKLVLELTPRQARDLIGMVTCSYEAINPPLTRGSYAASWQGMDDH